MKPSNIRRFKVLGLLGAPLIALALVVLLLSWGQSSTTQVAAEVDSSVDWHLAVKSGADPNQDCDTSKVENAKCAVLIGDIFTVSGVLNDGGAWESDNTFARFDFFATYTGPISPSPANATAVTITWPGSFAPATFVDTGAGEFGAGDGTANPVVFASPQNMVDTDFVCTGKGTGTITMIHGKTDTNVEDLYERGEGADETLDINCKNPPDTPTPTPTATPAPKPRFQKLDRYPINENGSQENSDPQDPGNDSLSNLWLTRQGAKIPSTTCNGSPEDSTDNALFSEVLSFLPVLPDPKGVHNQAFIGAFEFEVQYDEKQICVFLQQGEAATALGLTCIIEDSQTKNTAEGIARIGCVGLGKLKQNPPEWKDGKVELARVWVKPQPDVYSNIKPDQDNGIVVQLSNVGCSLVDEQGHPIGVFSCEDADVTMRYLEGDVEPDCVVNSLDTQAIAFRWGVEKGSLIYTEFMNLEPSGAQRDTDIDIADLQFVYGRFGSSCGRQIHDPSQLTSGPTPKKPLDTEPGSPHPRQEPVNPKQ